MTPRTRNIVTVSGFVFAAFLCYVLAISGTIGIQREYRKLQEEEKLFDNIPKQLSVLNEKNSYYDSLLKEFRIGGTSMQHNLLKAVNRNAEELNLKVMAFHEPHIFKRDGLSVHSYSLAVEGGFNDILTFVYRLEQQAGYGEIVNLHLEKKKNFRTGKEFLQAQLLIRNFD